jgi:protein-tyrosine phosphatase
MQATMVEVTMIDIHCHILPGLDDGPDALEQSLAMGEAAIADGITHVVATPHSSDDYFFDYPRIQKLRRELETRIGPRLTLATGCDFHMNPENLEALRVTPAQFCLNQGPYLLVEFNEFSIPPSLDNTLHEMQLAGIRPIITHPERNAILRNSEERLRTWVHMGCFIQVTANSLTGRFGALAERDALRWIGQGLVHFVASDAHNTTSRPLKLKPAYELIAAEFGTPKAEALLVENPKAAFQGADLPYVPEPTGPVKATGRKRFWLF